MPIDPEKSLGDAATFAGRARRPASAEMSLGAERTLGGGDAAAVDTVLDDIEVVDLHARYKIEGTLGEGGMGAVVLATDTRLGRKVAIKRILGEAARSRAAILRFLTEAKAIAALNHPNVVQIYDYGRAADGPLLIMEYVDGGSLLDRCRSGAIPLAESVDLVCQICDGLAKAHDAGIVHRDIKPANVLLNADGLPKLTDFGLAKAEASDHQMTMTGAVMGTPDFMPPEQRRDAAEVDHRSDLWSLAATLYQMVTGRSPKIIRFNDVPAALQDVLAKALEDRKDARYQSARDFRDALKTSVRAAALAVEELVEGTCPSCGIKNDSSRRFCRGCGESLEAPCLSCTKPMPMWEEICGQCGTKQGPLLQERRHAMVAKQAEAEGLLGDFEFDRALGIATQLRDEVHPKLKHLSGWATTFLEQIEKSQIEQTRQAIGAIVEAGKHEAAHDYLSAALVLETIPEAMRTAVLPGMHEPAARMLERIKMTQAEAHRLETLVKERLAAKQLDELLPDVEKLVALWPDREDIKRLSAQLLERQEKLADARDKAIEAAKANLAAYDYKSALASLTGVAAAAVTPEVVKLREQAEGLVRQVRSLARRIRDAVAAKELDGLIGTVEQYLTLKPGDSDVVGLLQSLRAREKKIAEEIASHLKQARKLEQACRFDEARKLLAAIPNARRWPEVEECLSRFGRLGPMRQATLAGLSKAEPGKLLEAIEASHAYRDALAQAQITDPEFAGLLSRTEAAHAQELRSRRLVFVTAMTAAGVVAAIVLAAAGLWMRSAARAASLASAIAESRWDDALAIEPGNASALTGRARTKLQASPPDVAGAFADLDRAERVGGQSPEIKTARGDGYALRAFAQAREDRLDVAAQDLAEAKRLGASHELVAAAQEAMMPLQARGLLLEAAALVPTGDMRAAAAKAIDATLLDMTGSVTALKLPANQSLRAAVVAGYRDRFDAGLSGDDWDSVLRIAAAAGALDDAAAGWVGEAIAKHPGGLSAVPPEVLFRLPAATIAGLPPKAIAALPLLRNSIGIELKLIPAGSFTMGDAGGDSDEKPHKVTLTRPYYLGVYEVTNAQWRQVMGSVPSEWKDDDRPVERVSWEDAVEFCRKLSALPEERKAGRVYRLPTEAEWEYACQSGTNTKYSFGDDESRLGEYAWYHGYSRNQTHPVGKKKPNAWGLYDMHGNVWEWCSDWYGEYPQGAVTDPQGPSRASVRVFRGGCWNDTARYCRSADRNWNDPSYRYNYLGFRLALSPSGASPPEAGK